MSSKTNLLLEKIEINKILQAIGGIHIIKTMELKNETDITKKININKELQVEAGKHTDLTKIYKDTDILIQYENDKNPDPIKNLITPTKNIYEKFLKLLDDELQKEVTAGKALPNIYNSADVAPHHELLKKINADLKNNNPQIDSLRVKFQAMDPVLAGGNPPRSFIEQLFDIF